MENFKEILWSVVGIILTGLASAITAKVVAWINSKCKTEKEVNFATTLFTIISNAVTSVMQTFVSTLKKEGKFDEEAQKEALNKAKEIIDAQLTEELGTYIATNFGDIDTYITSQIEAIIFSIKQQ